MKMESGGIFSNNRAQSTVEYLLLFAAAVAIYLVFFNPNGVFTVAANKAIETNINSMLDMSNAIFNPYNQP